MTRRDDVAAMALAGLTDAAIAARLGHRPSNGASRPRAPAGLWRRDPVERRSPLITDGAPALIVKTVP